AAPLEVAAEGGRGREQEKFLFYRGVGDLRPPVTVTALGGGSFAVRSAGGEPISALFLVEVRAGTVRYRRIGPLAPGASATIDLPETRSDAGPVRADLTAALMKAGLNEKEARAMVRTWESAWFGEDGARALYVLPAAWTEHTLPLRVTPKPDALVRVM